MTHVFIIPEPHLWDKTFKNRKSYPDEVMEYMQQVMGIISGYEGKRVIIFPGDIFHRSYGGIDGIITTFNLFKDLNTLTDNNVFSCVGNHELSFTYNNPFWIMAEDYTTRYVNLHGLKAFGTMHPGIKVVDELDIEDIRFLFGHYCRKDLADTSGKDLVFITHNSLLEPEIDKYVSDKFGIESKTEYMHTVGIKNGDGIPVTEKLKYVFVGHMHTFFGKFNVEENVQGTDLQFLLQYMGSLGRTSISEVSNVNLLASGDEVSETDVNKFFKTISSRAFIDEVRALISPDISLYDFTRVTKAIIKDCSYSNFMYGLRDFVIQMLLFQAVGEMDTPLVPAEMEDCKILLQNFDEALFTSMFDSLARMNMYHIDSANDVLAALIKMKLSLSKKSVSTIMSSVAADTVTVALDNRRAAREIVKKAQPSTQEISAVDSNSNLSAFGIEDDAVYEE